MLCDYFGLYEDCVKVIRTGASMALKKCTNYQESTSAYGAFGKSVCGLAAAVTASNKVKSLTKIMSALQVITSVLGIVITAGLVISGHAGLLSLAYAAVFQLLTLIVTVLPPYLSRP